MLYPSICAILKAKLVCMMEKLLAAVCCTSLLVLFLCGGVLSDSETHPQIVDSVRVQIVNKQDDDGKWVNEVKLEHGSEQAPWKVEVEQKTIDRGGRQSVELTATLTGPKPARQPAIGTRTHTGVMSGQILGTRNWEPPTSPQYPGGISGPAISEGRPGTAYQTIAEMLESQNRNSLLPGFVPQSYQGGISAPGGRPITIPQNYPEIIEGSIRGPVVAQSYPAGIRGPIVDSVLSQNYPWGIPGTSNNNQPIHVGVRAFSNWRDSQYTLYLSKMDWVTANKTCAEEGAHMAVINSDEEASFLGGIINRNAFGAAFVGITDEEQEGNWVTFEGESIASAGFARWYWNDQPNTNENCGAIMPVSGLLNDVACTGYLLHALCEKKVKNVMTSDIPGGGPIPGPIGLRTYPEGSTSGQYNQYNQYTPGHMVGPSRSIYTDNQPVLRILHQSNWRGSQYFLYTTKMDWVTAKKSCAAAGAHLAIINSEEEAAFLRDMTRLFLYRREVFVGITDEEDEGKWVTIDGEPIASAGFSRWFREDQPDNENGNENCGSIIFDNGGLNDVPCTNYLLDTICEKDIENNMITKKVLIPDVLNRGHLSEESTDVDNDEKNVDQDPTEQLATHVSNGRHVQYKEHDESILQSDETTAVDNDQKDNKQDSTEPPVTGILNGYRQTNASDENALHSEKNNGVFVDQKSEDEDEYDYEDPQEHVIPVSGYQRFPGFNSLYRYNTEYMNWETANSTCVEEGAHLAVINSEEEAKMLAALSERYDEDAQLFFVGISYVAEEGTWLTVLGETAAEAGYNRWFPGKKQPVEVTGNNCGAIFYLTGEYFNLSCKDHKTVSICEKDDTAESDSSHN